MPEREFPIDEANAGSRLDVFLAAALEGVSRSKVQAAIKSGLVSVDGSAARASLILEPGQTVSWEDPPAARPSDIVPEEIPLRILFEDKHFLAVNKEAGLVVHPGAGNWTGTLVGALLHHCGTLSTAGGDASRAGIVHRLDKETSGCLLVAKTDAAHAALSAQFAERKVQKTYLARVSGCPKRTFGTIDAPIARHPSHRQKMTVSDNGRGRDAITEFRVLGTDGKTSLLECRPKTGRTHQIRVHLKSIGHPVLGDPLYGQRGAFARHMLHAWKIAFAHPSTGKAMELVAAPDEPLLVPPEKCIAGSPGR